MIALDGRAPRYTARLVALTRFGLAISLITSCMAQDRKPETVDSKPAESKPSTESNSKAVPAAAAEGQAAQQRLQLNLLGQTDTASGESRRNENLQFSLIDTNTMREMNARVGTTATMIEPSQPERSYFGSEYGRPPTIAPHLPAGRDSRKRDA